MRNSGPEKEITEPDVLAWCKQNRFDMTVVDTSAVWNPMAGRYLRKQASESLPDLIGNYGALSVWIELKAPKSRSDINAAKNRHQRAFLIRKIDQGCFAVVTDGSEHLSMIWKKYRMASDFDKKAVLLADLPVQRVTRLSAHPGIASKRRRSIPAR